MTTKKDDADRQVIGLFGVGLDNQDGHKRLTRTEEFVILGGSAETHERMQDIAIYFGESLRERGKRLQETPVEEVVDLLNKAADQ